VSEHSSILIEGARRVWRRQRIVWWIWFVDLILALASSIPLLHRIGAVTDHSLAAQRLVNGFDWGTYSELLSTPDVNFGSAFPESTAAVLVFFVFMLFMTGGLLASYNNDYKLSTRDFFASCGAFLWRCVRLFLFLAIIAGAIMYGGHAVLHWGGRLINDAGGEKTGYWVALFAIVLTTFVMMSVRLWFDMAQVHAVVEDERAMRRSLKSAFKLTFSNFGSLFWLYCRISFLAWLGLAIGLWVWTRLSGATAIIMLEAVLLWWVGNRMWQRASEVAWYQRFAIAAARTDAIAARSQAMPEPTPIPATPDPLPPDE
jgi:hypothetical protein